MTTLATDPILQSYAIACVLLVATMYFLAFRTVSLRTARERVVNHEDVNVYSGSTVVETDDPDVQRVKRAHTNLLENAVPFFTLGLLYTQTAPSLMMARGLFFSLAGLRVLHAAFYLGHRQPFRTLTFVAGALVNAAMAIQVLRALM